MAVNDGYGEELPSGYVRKPVAGQRAIPNGPRTRAPRAPAPTRTDSAGASLARANALLNPAVQYSFRGAGGAVPQYQYAGENTPSFFGEALRRFQQGPNRVYGAQPPSPSLGQTQPGETEYQRILRLAKMAGF